MLSKTFTTLLLLAALAVPQSRPALADDLGSGIVGGVVGGIIGGAIVNQANKNRQSTVVRTYDYGQGSAQVADNRQVQTALNYFGFPAGTPDGVLGYNSRQAITNYQLFLGYPGTGDLNDFQHNLLLTSYNRAIAGGQATMAEAASNPMGMRGLLLKYRNEMAGIPQAPAEAAQPAAPAAPAAPASASAPAPAPGTALPNFGGAAQVQQASLASQCSKVSLMTTTNGGFITAAKMTDPNAALAEQFCLARTYAMSQGEDMMSKVQGFTPAQITQQCGGFVPPMRDYVSALEEKPRDAVLQDVAGFIGKTGMPRGQLDTTAKICLSVGYRTDNMDVALSSALLLTALGDAPYAELVADHIGQGFGVPARPDVALAWYRLALDALAHGTPAVFAPGQPDRTVLLRKAAFAAAGQPETTAPQPASLPSFAAPAAKN
ncbi:peptidoglycan-binding domain-containing protein [Solirhodobacter olei]|uniref:peptidoglycan-binding domain-containing protein n=1 Tax=Solirhodobacter olei TaxID=2493082 RepID=UPI000FD86AA0|nr:peptidoglycan-binding domain-containing protein [Solirhodobacter olei]